MSWFSAKILFQSFINDNINPGITEESIRIFTSDTEENAFNKATMIGKETEHTYDNEYGEKVNWRFIKIIEVQDLCEDTIYDGMEIYSTMSRP